MGRKGKGGARRRFEFRCENSFGRERALSHARRRAQGALRLRLRHFRARRISRRAAQVALQRRRHEQPPPPHRVGPRARGRRNRAENRQAHGVLRHRPRARPARIFLLSHRVRRGFAQPVRAARHEGGAHRGGAPVRLSHRARRPPAHVSRAHPQFGRVVLRPRRDHGRFS